MSANPARGHETRDVPGKWVFVVILGLFIFGMCLHWIIAGFLAALNHVPSSTDLWHPVKRAVEAGVSQVPFPLLQISDPVELQNFRSHEDAELNTYGWINRTSGIVRVPIDEAMNLVLQEGLPVRKSTNENGVGPSSYQLIQKRAAHPENEIQGKQ